MMPNNSPINVCVQGHKIVIPKREKTKPEKKKEDSKLTLQSNYEKMISEYSSSSLIDYKTYQTNLTLNDTERKAITSRLLTTITSWQTLVSANENNATPTLAKALSHLRIIKFTESVRYRSSKIHDCKTDEQLQALSKDYRWFVQSKQITMYNLIESYLKLNTARTEGLYKTHSRVGCLLVDDAAKILCKQYPYTISVVIQALDQVFAKELLDAEYSRELSRIELGDITTDPNTLLPQLNALCASRLKKAQQDAPYIGSNPRKRERGLSSGSLLKTSASCPAFAAQKRQRSLGGLSRSKSLKKLDCIFDTSLSTDDSHRDGDGTQAKQDSPKKSSMNTRQFNFR